MLKQNTLRVISERFLYKTIALIINAAQTFPNKNKYLCRYFFQNYTDR